MNTINVISLPELSFLIWAPVIILTLGCALWLVLLIRAQDRVDSQAAVAHDRDNAAENVVKTADVFPSPRTKAFSSPAILRRRKKLVRTLNLPRNHLVPQAGS